MPGTEPTARPRARQVALLLALVMASAPLLAAPAHAATVTSCNGANAVCIQVVTGSKNTSNGTQWVESVHVYATKDVKGTIEAWAGDGPTGVAWYRIAHNVRSAKWTVGMWIKNGSGVCGRHQHAGTACISIKV